MKKKAILISLGIVLVLAVSIGVVQIRYQSIITTNKKQHEENQSFSSSWSWTLPPFTYREIRKDILVEQDGIALKLWFQSLSGKVLFSIRDAAGNSIFEIQNRNIEEERSIPLKKGFYTLEISFQNYLGAGTLFYDGFFFPWEFPDGRFQRIQGIAEEGFHWDYLLFTPEVVSSPYLLVFPNNTGYPIEDYGFHVERAKVSIIRKSEAAETLAAVALVPIFPRYEGLYTHHLDRNTMLTETPGLERIDLQLIAMVDHARRSLAEKGIVLEEQILLSGFSASGAFADRFSLLHPERVKAAVIGGTGLMLPLEEFRDEVLPYPVGVFDMARLTGHPFDEEAFREVQRFVHGNALDEGGWETMEDGSRYTGREYFTMFQEPEILKELETRPAPLFDPGDFRLRNIEERAIRYRIFEGRTFHGDFEAVRELFEERGYGNHQFRVYPDAGHDVTNEIAEDRFEFLRRVIDE